MANDKDFIVKNAVEVGGPTNVTLGSITGNAIDLSTGNYFKDTLAANTTYTLSNAGDVQSFQLEVTGGVGEGYAVGSGSYTGVSYNVSTRETSPSAVRFKSDGTKMFITGIISDAIHEFDLSTAWDITTATWSKSLSTQVSNPECLLFNPAGTKVAAFGTGTSAVASFDLPTPWDLAGSIYLGQTTLSEVSANYGKGMAYNGDGTKFYAVSGTGQAIYQYTLSTAYDISTRSYDSVSFGTSPNSINPEDMSFNADGTKMYIAAYSPDTIAEYSLPTPYILTGATFTGNTLDISGETTTVNGFAFKDDGSEVFVVDQSNTTIFRYTSAIATTITWPTEVEWAGGIAPAVPSIGETDIFTVSTDDGGTSYVGTKTADNLS